MLPGFRFLFAATLLTVSFLVFGLGAAALLRASHERFAGLPNYRPAAAPVFAQVADAAPPSLSVLRIEPSETPPGENKPTPVPADTLLTTDRVAALTTAPRVDENVPPVVVDPMPDVRADIRPEPPKPSEPALEPPVQATAPVASPAETTVSAPLPALGPVVATKNDEAAATIAPSAVIAPDPSPQQTAALPEPEITGTTPPAAEPPLVNAKPIKRPPIPIDRPAAADAVAALPDPSVAAPLRQVEKKSKPVVRRVVKKRRVVRRERPAPPGAATPGQAAPFGT